MAGGDTQLSVAPTIEIGDGPTIRSIVKILSIDKATEQLSDLAVICINTVDPWKVTHQGEQSLHLVEVFFGQGHLLQTLIEI